MLKSKAKKRYYGLKAYADGQIGKVIEHSVTESYKGINEHYVVEFNSQTRKEFDKVLIVDKYAIIKKLNTTIAIVIVNGRTYTGTCTLSPNEVVEIDGFDRELALARAVGDLTYQSVLLSELDITEDNVENEDEDDLEDEDEDDLEDENLPF